ncbi:SDR family NAD(P)-dependent oxidoreductase [Niabella hibiscisoli]|uniref:SDR family NAD(P)-dependent oxidoreductase n=1 Tax=Niabella hibiscisoli TaxID=1825928 RepID=UPI001F0EDDF9|nr:SDR family oxidoreductase [Niabella hibiscisoli]MCH5719240.1 SDR family oxidoreductase [Niabella hibiscisoli]
MFSIDLKNKTVLITGVTSGIGRGIARQMALAGASVSGCASSPDDAGWHDEITGLGATALYTRCDVMIRAELEELVVRTVAHFGSIDILVSNAGGNVFTGAAESRQADWDRNMQLNLASHWHLSALSKPYLEKQGGVIIIMTSNHSYSSIPGCFPYNVAKTALTGLVRSLAIEWGPAIRTVGIAPGFIDTPGNQEWFDSFTNPAAERQRTIDRHPVKKLGTVDEIGGWCVFLASTYAAFASGTTYLIDGGRSALMQDSQ